MKFSNFKMQNKLLATLIPTVMTLFMLTIIIVYTQTDTIVKEVTYADAQNQAYRFVNEVQRYIESPLINARQMAVSFTKFKDIKIEERRNFYSDMLKATVEDNPGFLGAWTIWEPNALDGMDEQYKNTKGHDATGRFLMYWNIVGGLHPEAVVDYNTGTPASDYYTRSLKSMKEVVMEPFQYEVAGKTVLLVSLVAPIIVDGKAVGVTGIDIDMNFIKDRISMLRPYETGYAMLMANNSLLAGHPNHKLVGTILGADKKVPEFADAVAKIKSGTEFNLDIVNLDKNREEKIFFVPFTPGRTQFPWSLAIACPTKEVLAKNQEILNMMIIIGVLAVLLISIIIFILARFLSKPLIILQDAADNLARGQLNFEIGIKAEDEIGKLADSFRNMKQSISGVINEISDITDSTTEGKLDTRCKVDQYEGSYKDIVIGVNNTLDAVIGPLNVTAEYVDRISKGDIPQKITDDYQGDYIEIKNNVNALIDNLNNYASDIKEFIEIQSAGDYEFRIKTDGFHGVFKDMAEGTNQAISIHVNNILDILSVVGAYGSGDLTKELRAFPGKAKIANELVDKVRNNLQNVINEMNGTIHNMVEGKLESRADASKFSGSYNEMIEGLNEALDAVISPLNLSARYVARIANGDIPQAITDNYKGDYNSIKNNINLLISNLNSFVDEMTIMSDAHLVGQIDVFVPTDKFQGAYHKMALGLNTVVQDHINGVMEILDVIESYGQGDFSEAMPDLKGQRIIATQRVNKFRDNLIGLKSDIDTMIEAARAGQLDKRADSSKYQGGWEEIVSGINNMLENTSKPIHQIVGILNNIVVNDYSEKIDSDYEGTWLELKNSVNNTMLRLEHIQQILINISNGQLHELDQLKAIGQRSINDQMIPSFIRMMDAIQGLVADTVVLSEAAVKGDFDKRADEAKHSGDYQKVVIGLNKTIEAFVGPLNITGEYLEKIAKGEEVLLIDENNYSGGFKQLVLNLNLLTSFLKVLVEDVNETADASVNGDLNTRIDLSKYPLVWKSITGGINKTLDAVVKPINEAMAVLEVMATGDMTVRMEGHYQGDHELLKNSINMLSTSLSQLIIQLTQSIQEVGEASDSISGSTDTIASSAAEQSSQVDEVAAAMEEMARTITENSSNANKTASFAQNNGTIATEGGTVVEQTISKMREIAGVVNKSAQNIEKLGQSSKEIGEIISVIDEIADQTNLLALNAAIEAARAGEQGRGFAVVADEVRKLAERTTEATKQIANMIKGIQSETMEAVQVMHKGNEEVSEGISLADNAGISLKQVVHSSQDVLDMINSIAASSEEQAATGEQISKNINTISIVSNDSARNIEDIAHSAEQMAALTIKVRELIQQFKVDFGAMHDFPALEGNQLGDDRMLTS